VTNNLVSFFSAILLWAKTIFLQEECVNNFFRTACVALLLAGCAGTAGSRNIVSPSLPEDEAARHVRTLPVTEIRAAAKEEPVLQREDAQRNDNTSTGFSANGSYAQEALIILLEKKGIITSEELNAEIKKLKAE
jgi:hypothetical protein